MPTTPLRTFSGDFLKPLYNPADALLITVQLAPGTYAKGTVLGQVIGTGTAVNDVQTVSIASGSITDGTYRLVFEGAITSALDHDDVAADIEAALEALSTIGDGNVTVTGGPADTADVVITFGGTLAGRPMPAIVLVDSSVGGTLAITHTTTGKQATGYHGAYVDSTLDPATLILQYATVVDVEGNHQWGGGEWGFGTSKGVPAYYKGTFLCADLVGLDAAAITDLNGRLINGDAYTDTYAILHIG